MATALSGSLGWSGLYPTQLGGPPLANTFTRPLSTKAVPLIAHVYENDGVTSRGTLPVLNWTSIDAATTNGSYSQVTLNLATANAAAVYGQSTYGQSTYGAQLLQGNVVRLSEVGGPWNGFVYGGIVEDLPDSVSPLGVTHSALLTPFAFELDDVQSTSVYFRPTDVSQIVRDAVAQTFHCSCDQVSVPPATGIAAPLASNGNVDFRGQTIKQQIDTCRSIAGPTWFWYVDELGRVWFQAMGSAASYTVMRGPNYEQRTTSASIQNRKNRITVVGGVPSGGSVNAVGVYNGASQAAFGVRALTPSLSMPNITDQATLNAMAANVGAVLDRVWKKVNLTIHLPYAQRIHGSQPGGPMLRYWEPTKSALSESEAGSGSYAGPFIVQSVSYDQLHQTVVAGDIPVTSQVDAQNMVNTLVNRVTANSIQVTAAALNTRQTLTGSFQSGGGTTVLNSQGAVVQGAMWTLGQQEFQAVDPFGIVRAEMGNLPANGISPAQWGFRANGASGSPIFDSLGLIAAANLIASETLSTSITAGSGAGWTVVQTIPGSGANFTLTRPGNLMSVSVLSTVMTAGALNYMALFHAVWTQSGSLVSRHQVGASQFDQNVNHFHTLVSFFINLAAGSYQFRQEFALDAATTDAEFGTGSTGIAPTASVIQLGG